MINSLGGNMNNKQLISYLGQLKFKVNSDFMSEPIDEIIEQLERFEEFKKEIVWCEDDTKYGHPVYNRATIGYLYKQKFFPEQVLIFTIKGTDKKVNDIIAKLKDFDRNPHITVREGTHAFEQD